MMNFSKKQKTFFWHVHKTGGSYIEFVLIHYYEFKSQLIKKSDKIMLNNINVEEEEKKEKEKEKEEEKEEIRKLKIENIHLKSIIKAKNEGYFGKLLNNYISKLDIDDFENYFKFAFVRNPYDRAISSYEFIKQRKFDNRVNQDVLNEECTFTNFYKQQFKYNNNTFMHYHAYESQYTNIKNNCSELQIDYIAKYENINEELIYILKKIGIEDYTKHLRLIDEECRVNASQKRKLSEYFTEEALEEINMLFHDDFEKFGYKKFYNLEELNSFLDTIEETEKNSNKKLLEFYNYQSKELTEEDILKEFS